MVINFEGDEELVVPGFNQATDSNVEIYNLAQDSWRTATGSGLATVSKTTSLIRNWRRSIIRKTGSSDLSAIHFRVLFKRFPLA